jgi:hypothetical protein
MPEKKTATPEPRELFVVTTPASTADAELRIGQVAEAGAKILKTHAHLFKPLTVTYKA